MRQKIDKCLKIALGVTGMIALLVFSAMLGTRIERERQAALEAQKERVSAIAVVNMDNGVSVGNEQINYASQLMSFPNDHFVVTGLTDAKAGVQNGTYAAYVVIPETFSASVTSIENEPQKVTLVYGYNSKLVKEAEIQAVNDINAFVVLLNSNIAYMYVDAIMNEFHRVQDDSSVILANDSMEMERLASVNAASLIAVAEPVEEMSVDSEIDPVELTAYTTRNDSLLEYLLSGYLAAMRRGKDDYQIIQGENAEVMAAADSFLQAYDTAIQETVAEQSKSLATGRDKLAEAIGLYNRDVDEQETALRGIFADIINMQLETDRNAADAQLQKIIEDIRDREDKTLKDLQEQWQKKYQSAQNQWEKEKQDLREQWEEKYQSLQNQWEEKYGTAQEQWEEEYQTAQEQWEKEYQTAQEQWEKENEDLQEQWEKKYQALQDQCNGKGQNLQALQDQWIKAYQALQIETDKELAQKKEDCSDSLEQVIREVYIQGYNNALKDLDGQIDSMKEDVDSENIAVSVLQAALEKNKLSEPLAPETETNLKGHYTAVDNHLSGISIDWSQLNVTLPTVSGNESVSGGDAPGGEVSGGDNSGGEEPGGEGSGGDNSEGEGSEGDNSGREEPGGEGLGGDNSGGEEPGGEGPGGDNSGEEEPGGEKPGGDISGGDGTGGKDPGGEGTGEDAPEEDPGGEDPGGNIPEDPIPDKGQEVKYEISLTAFNDEEVIGNAVKETFNLFRLEAESEHINGVIQTYFIDALSKESERQMGRMADAKQMLSQNMEDYENRLLGYDPMQYIENANLVSYLDDIGANASEMLNKIKQNNSEYMLYASEIYSDAMEHTTKARSSLDKAYAKTEENVKGCIDDLISSRTETNSQNADMLEGFTDSLKYTRVESQGNAEVYDYIVNPVVSRSDGQAAASTNTAVSNVRNGNPIKTVIIIVLGLGILLCLAEVIVNLQRQNKKHADEPQDLY